MTLESCINIAAYGTVVKASGPQQFLHGNPLPKNCLRVCIDQSFEDDAILPFPGECDSVGEAVGSHVAWPTHLIKKKDKVILFYQIIDYNI